jgi:uncharacterized RDD family membrane protein YckC
MNWYYLENGVQRGPITEADFPALFQTGALGTGTYLWREGMAEWKTYGELLQGSTPSGATSPQSPPSDAAATRTGECSRCGDIVPYADLQRIGTSALCPKCQTGYQRVAQIGFGKDASVEYAQPLLRLMAAILDDIICVAGAVAIVVGGHIVARQFVSDPDQLANIGIGLVVAMVMWILFYFVGQIARSGATIGMKLFKIKVVTVSGLPVGVIRAFWRLLAIRLVNVFTAGLGHLIVFLSKEKRSLHDFLCGTIVIKKPRF